MIAVLLLAAGESRRMGRPKQLLPWCGKPLVRHAAETALQAQADELLVVLGAHAEAVAAALHGLTLRLVQNPGYATGQAGSLRVGLAALPADADAAIVLLADQPLLKPALLDALIAERGASRAPLVVPRHGGQRGNPVLLGRELFAELAALEGDTGARPIFERHREQIAWVEAPPAVLFDVDSPAAYAALLELPCT